MALVPRGRDRCEKLTNGSLMATFSIELPDEQAERLRDLAKLAGVSPEEMLGVGLREWLARPQGDFAEAAVYVLQNNAELYKRLA